MGGDPINHSKELGLNAKQERKPMEGWKDGSGLDEFMFPKITLVTSWSVNGGEEGHTEQEKQLWATSAALPGTRRGSPGLPPLVHPPHPHWRERSPRRQGGSVNTLSFFHQNVSLVQSLSASQQL